MNIGIVGARKYQDKQSVIDLVSSLPADSVIIVSSCKGVCTWAKEEAEKRNMKVLIFSPNLSNIRARFEIPKRYYERNRDLVEMCDFLHVFISQEDGYIGGTKFETEYALKLGIPVQIYWENGISELIYQYPFSFLEKEHAFFLSWQEFFCKTNLEIGG